MAQGKGGKGYSGRILDRSQALLTSAEAILFKAKSTIAEIPQVPYDKRWAWGGAEEDQGPSSSDNHEGGTWGNEMLRAAIFGTDEQFEAAKRVMVDWYYPRELARGPRGVGLGASEVLTPDNHTHQHLNGPSLGRLAAVISQDKELLDLSGQLLCRWSSVLQALSTLEPSYNVCSAGYRAHGRPWWFSATAWLRQVKSVPVKGVLADPFPGKKPDKIARDGVRDSRRKDPYLFRESAPIRAIRLLQLAGDDLGGARAIGPSNGGPVFKAEVQVYRSPGRHIVILPKSPNSPPAGVCDWVDVRHHDDLDTMMEAVRFGMDWATPPPDIPKGSSKIVFPAAHTA